MAASSARPQDVGGNAMTSLEEDYVASEDIFASYAMGTWDVGARIIGGVRVENTRFKRRQPGGCGSQRPQHRHPARGHQQLHQRAAGPAPALRRGQ